MSRDNHQDRHLTVGTRVKLDHSEQHRQSEFGVVIHCWFDDEIQSYDCYVAFFGDQFPNGKPGSAPYVLRYASKSLVVLGEEFS